MHRTALPWSKTRIAVMVALSAALSGCGGGDGDAPPLLALLDITAANRDDVAHVTVAGLMSLPTTGGTFGMLPLAAGRALAGVWSVGPVAVLLQSVGARGATPGDGRSDALAVSSSDYPCDFGGTVSDSFDDRDGNDTISAGDVETIAYRDCMISATETMNGTARLAVMQIGNASASFQLDLVQYSDSTARHSLTVNGSVLLDLAIPTSTMVETTMTTRGPVVVSVSSHVPFSDTVTLQNGFVMKETYDAQTGQAASTFTGRLESVAVGGMIDVSTMAGTPITMVVADDYPSAGTLRIKGGTGTLLLNVLSRDAVRLDLDANDDGAIESSTAQSWDWLL